MANRHAGFQTSQEPLIKFQSKALIDSLQNGLIYANTMEFYRQKEQGGDEHVGDAAEGMFPIANGSYTCVETGKTIPLNNELFHTKNSFDYVFCMFNCSMTSGRFSFNEQQKKEMLAMGDTALLITEPDEFKRRVKLAAEKRGFEVHFGKVQYYDESKTDIRMLISGLGSTWKYAFWKRDRYSYQQEARFLFSPYKRGMDHIELEIGKIDDISRKLPVESVFTLKAKEIDV